MELALAQRLAAEVKDLLAPACYKVEVAGGVRRGKAQPHDLEIVAQPSSLETFGYLHSVDERMHELLSQDVIQLGDPFVQHREVAGVEKEILCKAPFSEKYYRVKYQEQKVDVFVCTPPASWGVEYLLRTGDGGHNIWIVTKGYPRGIYFLHGALHQHVDAKGRYIPEQQSKWKRGDHRCDLKACGFIILRTPDESDVFKALNLPWKDPKDRVVWTPPTVKEWEEALA